MTLSQYVLKRNGVPLGASRSMRNMLTKSLGAKNFSEFWIYWNPIFSYYLGYKVFKPLKAFLPTSSALVLTFLVSGLIHDLAALLIVGKTAFVFSIWFVLIVFFTLISELVMIDLSGKKWILRAVMNVLYLGASLALALFLRNLLSFSLAIR